MSKALELANEYLWDDEHCAKAAAELRRLADIEQEHRALLVNEQNLREELVALRASLGEPVAWINKDHTYVELSTPSTVYGSHTIPLYALSNKETK